MIQLVCDATGLVKSSAHFSPFISLTTALNPRRCVEPRPSQLILMPLSTFPPHTCECELFAHLYFDRDIHSLLRSSCTARVREMRKCGNLTWGERVNRGSRCTINSYQVTFIFYDIQIRRSRFCKEVNFLPGFVEPSRCTIGVRV